MSWSGVSPWIAGAGAEMPGSARRGCTIRWKPTWAWPRIDYISLVWMVFFCIYFNCNSFKNVFTAIISAICQAFSVIIMKLAVCPACNAYLLLFLILPTPYNTIVKFNGKFNWINIVSAVANLVALSKLGVESESERSDKKPTESPLKVRRPLEKSKTTLLAHTESNSGQTKPPNEGRTSLRYA